MDFETRDAEFAPEPEDQDAQALRRRFLDPRHYRDYVEERIQEAQERGDFDNLRGMGQPLDLTENPYVGDKALSYRLLKNNDFAPREVELGKEIRTELTRARSRLTRLQHRSRTLRARRLPPFPSEKRAFNAAVRNASAEYGLALRELNQKILTLNISAPSALHMVPLSIEKLLEEFQASCPLFPESHS